MTEQKHESVDLGANAGLGAWMLIATAPRDGTWVLLAGGECDYADESDANTRPVVGQWSNYLNGGTVDGHWQFAWYDGGYYGEYKDPTHWMPLPAPPVRQHEDNCNDTFIRDQG